jgi:aminocarboxymuconate-semialdehyde decarboxylase
VIVDVHGHITHPELIKRYPMPPALADIEGMLDRKSAAGIELTIVGSPVGFGTMTRMPGLDIYAQPLDELKMFHEWLAETVRKYAPRLAAYAFTNPLGGAELLDLTAETVREGGFVGLIVNTSVKGEYLDSPRADDFFAMAAELGVPIFLHPPAEPVGSDSIADFRLVEQAARFCDVALGLATLVFGGRMEQYPELEFIAATGGGPIGLLVDRLDQAYQPRHWGGGKPGDGPPAAAERGGSGGGPGGPPGGGRPGGGPPGGGPPGMPQYENKIPKPPSAYLERVYVDTASFSRPQHEANLRLMGPDRMLFGTDSPPLAKPFDEAIGIVEQLPVSDDDKQKILQGNAQRLFELVAPRNPTEQVPG